jgi:hypothetical protein
MGCVVVMDFRVTIEAKGDGVVIGVGSTLCLGYDMVDLNPDAAVAVTHAASPGHTA